VNLPIHSHSPLTPPLENHRVRALFTLFRYSSSFDGPADLKARGFLLPNE
jgi:hypothetical protein